jgi:hypothetical protein
VIYDLGLVLLYSKQFPDRGTIIHHLLFLLLCGTTGHIKLLHGCGLLFTVNEVTTPSLNLRWHLMRLADVLHVTWPRAELCNMLFMFVGFLLFRIVPNTRVTWRYFQLLINSTISDKKPAIENHLKEQPTTIPSDKPTATNSKSKSSFTMTSRERNVMFVLFLFLASATGLNWYWFALINKKAWELLFPVSAARKVASEPASALVGNVASQC